MKSREGPLGSSSQAAIFLLVDLTIFLARFKTALIPFYKSRPLKLQYLLSGFTSQVDSPLQTFEKCQNLKNAFT